MDDLAKSILEGRLHESTTFHVETEAAEQRKTSGEIESEQQPGSSRPLVDPDHGRSVEAHGRPGAVPAGGGCGQDVAGGSRPYQGEDRQDVQRLHLRRDVEESQELGEVDDQVVRGQQQASTPDATPVRSTKVGPGRDESSSLPAGELSQGQEQGLQPSIAIHRDRGGPERNQDGDGGRDGCMGDGRGRGHVERDRSHPERSGAAVGTLGQHGEHDIADPHPDPVLAADAVAPDDTRCVEQLTRLDTEEALMTAGDIDAHEHEKPTDISGHDQQLVQRLIQKYAREIHEIQSHAKTSQSKMFLFEVFCGNQSQLGKQCEAAQVPFQRFSRERGDLETLAGRRELFRELVQQQPLHVWFAPTCTVWSGWAELNGSKSLEAYKQLTESRIRMLQQVALGLVLLRFQLSHGRHMHWEQPRKSLMNRLACLRELRQLCHQADFDMCVVGHLECPQTGLPMRKSTTVFTTHAALYNTLHGQMCTQHDEHQPIEGSVLFQGERVNRSRFSENYTRRFARQVIRELLSRVENARAFAIDNESMPPTAKRVKTSTGEALRIGKRAEPTEVQRLDETKRQRLSGKQQSPIAERARELVKLVHEITPRVGKVTIRDAAILSRLQELFPEKQIQYIMACRGTDRTIGPPDGMQPQQAPWRRALMIRRHDGALVMETQWEAWDALAKTRIVRTNHACKLNITAFGSDLQDIASRPSETPPDNQELPAEMTESAGSPGTAGCSWTRVHAEVTDPRQGWAFRHLSGSERQWLAKVHKNLGHPTPERLAQALRAQGYQSRIVEAARQYQCSTCTEGKHASLARPATLRDPLDFNDRVSMDALVFTSGTGQQFRIYHLVDHGTSYQTAFVTVSGDSGAVIAGMTTAWLAWAGAPGELCVDAGRELNSETFQRFLQSHNIKCHTIASRAHWQNGRAERHGALLQTMLEKFDKEQAISTTEDMQQALWAITQAKNALSVRRGYSPEILVLGKATRIPGSVVSDESQPAHLLAESETAQGVAFRQQLLRREIARKAFIEADNATALRRAALRQSRPDRLQHKPGEWIMMLVQKGNLPNQAVWLGPLKVMLQSDQHVVWASGSDRLYNGAPEHCRPVSLLEARRIPEHGSLPVETNETIPQPRGSTPETDEILRGNPRQQIDETTSIETLSQPDHEPSRQASSNMEARHLESQDAAAVPVPESEDELFTDGGYATPSCVTTRSPWPGEPSSP